MRLPTCTEYNLLADTVKEDNGVMHWKGIYSWCQDADPNGPSNRAVRGYLSARSWNYLPAAHRSAHVGFRPALEYLGPVPCSPDTLVGRTIKVYFSGGVSIEGCLVDFSDYDIILKPVTPMPADCPRTVKDSYNIVVSRDNIIWLKES